MKQATTASCMVAVLVMPKPNQTPVAAWVMFVTRCVAFRTQVREVVAERAMEPTTSAVAEAQWVMPGVTAGSWQSPSPGCCSES